MVVGQLLITPCHPPSRSVFSRRNGLITIWCDTEYLTCAEPLRRASTSAAAETCVLLPHSQETLIRSPVVSSWNNDLIGIIWICFFSIYLFQLTFGDVDRYSRNFFHITWFSFKGSAANYLKVRLTKMGAISLKPHISSNFAHINNNHHC